jgi:hypothetical protein
MTSTRTRYEVQTSDRHGSWYPVNAMHVEVSERAVLLGDWDGREAGEYRSNSRDVHDCKNYLVNVIPPEHRAGYRIVEIVSTMTVVEL